AGWHRVDHDLIAFALQLGLECGAVHGFLPRACRRLERFAHGWQRAPKARETFLRGAPRPLRGSPRQTWKARAPRIPDMMGADGGPDAFLRKYAENRGVAAEHRGEEFMLIPNDLTEHVIGLAIDVHNELGPGLLESAYETCLALELKGAGIPFRRQAAMPI